MIGFVYFSLEQSFIQALLVKAKLHPFYIGIYVRDLYVNNVQIMLKIL